MKEILTKKEFDDFLESFKNMILDLVICTTNIESIIEQRDQNYKKIKLIVPFLGHYVSLCYSYCAITLSKLFIQEEKRSLRKFLNKLENFEYDAELKDLLKNNDIISKEGFKNEYEYLFKNKKDVTKAVQAARELINDSEKLINKIKARRDSVYAHLDPDKMSNIEVESLEDINELIGTAQKIHTLFFGGFKNSTFLFSNLWSIDDILNLSIDYFNKIEEEKLKDIK